MKWKLSLLAILILLSQLLIYSNDQVHDDCCVNQVQLPAYVLASNGYLNVNVSEAKQMIETNPSLVILDVRTLEEYNEGHIENAVLIPVSELESRLDELDIEDEILVYCRSGVRSATASQILVDNGFTGVYNMLGGITAWKNAGYWIEITHEGDLIIDGAQTYVIENCTYIQTGNIYVRDSAKFSARHARLQINQTLLWQCEFQVQGYGILELEDTILASDFSLDFNFLDYSEITFNKVTLNTGERFSILNFYHHSKANVYNFTSQGGQIFGFHDYSEAYIENSIIEHMNPTETSGIEVSNSSIGVLTVGFTHGSIGDVNDLKGGFFEYLDLKEKVSSSYHAYDLKLNKTFVEQVWLSAWYDSKTTISDSILQNFGLSVPSGISVTLEDLGPRFYELKEIGEITLNKTSISGWIISMDADIICTISNSEASLALGSNPYLYIVNSVVNLIHTPGGNFVGSLHFDNTTWRDGIMIFGSDCYIYGNISFRDFTRILWQSNNVTRNYNVIAKNTNGDAMENVELTLYDQDNTVIWNGTTDSYGKSNFNITFTDSNYTATLRLETVKGNYSATIGVSFLSDTPIVLTMRYVADLNADGIINILDIALVAKAYGSILGDPNWNPIADVAEPYNEINILDIATVAKDYGKTV